MHRRWFGGVLAWVLAAGVIGAACGSDEPAGDETTTTAAASITTVPVTTIAPETTTTVPTRFGGSAVWGDDIEPTTLNPYAPNGDYLITRKIGQAIFARGWDYDPVAGEIVGDVLAEMPTVANGAVIVNGDGTMTVDYLIRDEAAWSDGTPLTGSDLAFTIDALAALVDPDADFGPVDRVYAEVAGYEVGEKSITVTFGRPTIEYEGLFDYILPRHAVEGTDLVADWNEVPFLGAGPFVFAGWEPGQRITLVRNPNYWKVDAETGERLPYLDELIVEFEFAIDLLLRAFAERELDAMEVPPTSELWYSVDADDPAISLQVVPGPLWEHVSFQFGPNNRNQESLNHDLDYRRALAHAIGDSLDGVIAHWMPIDSYLDAGVGRLSTGAWDRYGYDPEAAVALLDQVRADEGVTSVKAIFTTSMNADERPRVAQALADALGAVGIEYENQLEDSQLFFQETTTQGTFDIGMWAWVMDPTHRGLVSMLDLFDPAQAPPDGVNYYRWGTADSSVRDEFTDRYVEIAAAARSTVDGAEIDRLAVEAEQLLADQVVVIPLWSRSEALAHWADEIAGPVPNPTSASSWWNVEEWYRVDG